MCAGVKAVFSGAYEGGAKSAKLEIDEVGPLGSTDSVFERSHYTFYKEDGSIFDKGKYVYISSLLSQYRKSITQSVAMCAITAD